MSAEVAPAADGATTPAGPAAQALRLVVFELAGSRCAFPLEAVERVVPMPGVQPVPGAPRVILGAIDVAGRVVPVVDLRRRLDLAPPDYGLGARLLILRTSRRTLAVPADDVTGCAEVDRHDVAPAAMILPGLGQVQGV